MAAMVLTAGVALLLPNRSAAETISERESNNSLATAQNINGHFTLDYSPDIGEGSTSPSLNTSETIPHVTIVGSGDGTFDYYSFYVPGWPSTSGRVILDIDWTTPGFDSILALWAADGTGRGLNDDYDPLGGAGGSTSDYDSLWGGTSPSPAPTLWASRDTEPVLGKAASPARHPRLATSTFSRFPSKGKRSQNPPRSSSLAWVLLGFAPGLGVGGRLGSR